MLRAIAVLAGVVAYLVVAMGLMGAGRSHKSNATALYALEVEGVNVGMLKSVDGGDAYSDVVQEKVGADHVARKHLSGLKYTPIKVEFGSGMAKPLHTWITDTLARRFPRKSGRIVYLDSSMRVTEAVAFDKALISEVGMPACDANGKSAGYVTLSLVPQKTYESKQGVGSAYKGASEAKEQGWTPSHFRVTFANLDGAGIEGVSAADITVQVLLNPTGELRDYAPEPGLIGVPNITLTMAEAKAATWKTWFDDFLVHGNNDETKEKKGSIEYLSGPGGPPLWRLDLSGVGIFSLGQDSSQGDSGQAGRIAVGLYCEDMQYSAPGETGGGGAGQTSGSTSSGGSSGNTTAHTGGKAHKAK